MALTSAQITAFKVASGDVDLNVVHLTSVGMLVAVLFLWAAWGLSDAWSGWRNGDVRNLRLSGLPSVPHCCLSAVSGCLRADFPFSLRRHICLKTLLLSVTCVWREWG